LFSFSTILFSISQWGQWPSTWGWGWNQWHQWGQWGWNQWSQPVLENLTNVVKPIVAQNPKN